MKPLIALYFAWRIEGPLLRRNKARGGLNSKEFIGEVLITR
jgi:hypothetical protein